MQELNWLYAKGFERWLHQALDRLDYRQEGEYITPSGTVITVKWFKYPKEVIA